MTHTSILAKFLELFPEYQNKIRLWQPKGHNSIKVETRTGQKLEFVYQDDKNWILGSYTGKKRKE
jgi:hypothetical protein